uniref:D-isomer specific 2-hydroxyacid dehydrogenase NAD-binding domain-containing protein n=1 Tax=Ananas comosus var. bracteatus TaxID=296719 RepID=A0A6V7QUZ5_ANACO
MAEVAVENGNDSITRVLFCGYYFPASHNYTREYLQSYPFIQVDTVALDEVPDVIHNCTFQYYSAQLDFMNDFVGVDVDAATKHKIKVARIPGSATGNSTSCAEMAIYLMLGLLRKQKELEISVKQRKLGEPTGDTLLGKTVFILGFGAIGFDLAKRLRPFGVKILATKRRWSSDSLPSSDSSFPNDDIDGLIDKKGGPGNMYEFAAEADIVVTCLTLYKETAGIVDAKFLSSMKKGSLLLNIARGGLLDYESVLHHLESGHLGGLGIDVAWTEPFDPEDPILKLPNVLITPHVAGVTEYSYRTMAKVVGDCALQLHSGKPFTGIEIVN